MRTYDENMEKDRIVMLLTRDLSLDTRYPEVKRTLEKASGVIATTFTAVYFGVEVPQIDTQVVGEKHLNMGTLVVDHDFAEVFGAEVIAGRTFDKNIESDATGAFIINESALPELGFDTPEDALGAPILWGYFKPGKIIGVIKDFHFEPVKYDLLPLILHVRSDRFNYVLVKISGEDIPATLASLEEAWEEAFPHLIFEYEFLDDRFDYLYRTEERMGKTFGYFAMIAIFVACLGLLGFASFMTEQRTKEIGIRKSFGASAKTIVTMLSVDFLRLVLLAIVVGWPLAYLLMRRWLQDFPLRTDIAVSHFLIAGLFVALSAWLAVGYQAIRAALANPSESLSYE
jgi:putative ABC transport system permease protein